MMGMQSCRKVLWLAGCTLLLSGLAVRGQDCVTPYQSAARNSELTYVAQAMERTGLVTAFNSSDLVATIFLPKNIAFENLLTSIGMTVDQAFNNAGAFTPFLGQILEYHVVPNVVLFAENFTSGQVLPTVIQDTLTVNLDPLTITPSGGGKAAVTFTDFIACKSIEHVLDTVLLPQSIVQQYTASMNGGGAAAAAPLVMATSGADVLAQAIATAPVVAPLVPVALPVVPVAQVPAASIIDAAEATKTQAADKVASELQALKPVAVPSPPPVIAPGPIEPVPVSGALPVSGVTTAPPPPAVIELPKKEALLLGLKDKISSKLIGAPPPPLAVSGAPTAVSGTPLTPVPALPAAGPVTALELPKVDVPLPLPKKKEILPPVGLDVPLYKFKLPDIKAELLALGKDALSKLGLDKLIAATPPPPMPVAVSGAPITPVAATPVVPDLSALLPVKKDIPILDSLKNQLLPQSPPPPAVPTAVSGAPGTVTAASGPEPQGVIVVGDDIAYNVSTTCSTVPAVAQMVPSMADFLAALQATGLDMALNNDTAMMTVFVPVNAAFDVLAVQTNQTLGAILAQTDMLKQVLEYHVVPGVSALAANLSDGEMLQTALPNQTIKVQAGANGVKLLGGNGVVANVIYPDVVACNAIIHVIDAVLAPVPAALPPMLPAAAAAATMAAAMGPQPMPVPAAGGRH